MNENYWHTRWTKEQIKAMLLEQFHVFWRRETGIERSQLHAVEEAGPLPHAVVISGLRRVGKSTLLAQLAHRLGEKQYFYVNFEDDRFLGFQTGDADALYRILVEIFGDRRIFLIDEIQHIPEWERFIRRFMDMGIKFYITGSNASLLSRELGNILTGRYVPVELFPFSFREYFLFKQRTIPDPERLTTVEAALLRQSLDEYVRYGGIPEPLAYPGLPLLRTLYDDILHRDIASRYRITEIRAFKELAFQLLSNISNLASFNKLKERLHLGSVNTVKSYIDYLEGSWLLFTVNVYDFSVKRQQIAPKKVYAIDTGLAGAVGYSFSPNTGRFLENVVYLALRRETKDIYYYTTPGGGEVDFYLPASRRLIQVTQCMDDPETSRREVRALMDAMKTLGIAEALILSEANALKIEEDGRTIEIRALAEWLLER
ncbi:MAG: ATP-binding protein [Syntrophales bacterium]